jgi:YD repeat-containing protein
MQTQPADETKVENVIQYQNEVIGNLISSVDSMSRQELYTYDNESRMLTKKVQKLDGSEAREESIKCDKAGNLRFKTDANGNTTELTYDSMNRVKTSTIKVKNVNNIEITHTTTYTYDKSGNKTIETDWRVTV